MTLCSLVLGCANSLKNLKDKGKIILILVKKSFNEDHHYESELNGQATKERSLYILISEILKSVKLIDRSLTHWASVMKHS